MGSDDDDEEQSSDDFRKRVDFGKYSIYFFQQLEFVIKLRY